MTLLRGFFRHPDTSEFEIEVDFLVFSETMVFSIR